MCVHLRATISIKLTITYLHTWVERGNESKEHNTMSLAEAQTRTTWSERWALTMRVKTENNWVMSMWISKYINHPVFFRLLYNYNWFFFYCQAPTHKFVVSHWGKTSSLVASGLSLSCSRTWINGPRREGCAGCTNNRQENILTDKSDKNSTSSKD